MVLTIPIPVEIIIEIIEHVPLASAADRIFLSQCSTLSRAFVTPCQSRLFSEIQLFSYKGPIRCQRLHNILTHSPQLARFIHKLVIQNGWSTQYEPRLQKHMWAITEPTLPCVLDLLPALQYLYLNSSTTVLLQWSIMGPALQTSLSRLFALPSLTNIRLRNMKISPTVFGRSFQLADLGLFRSELEPSDHSQSLSASAVSPARPRLRSLSITLEVADAVLQHLSTTLDISHLSELILIDVDRDGLNAVAAILKLSTSSLVRLGWIFPKFSNFVVPQNVDEPNPLTLSPRIRSLEVSVWDWLNDGEIMPPFIWVLRTLKDFASQPEKSMLEEITLRLSVEPFFQYCILVQSRFWDDLDNTITSGDTFNQLRRVTLILHYFLPPDENEVAEQWTNPMVQRLPRLASRDMLFVERTTTPVDSRLGLSPPLTMY